MVCDIERIAGSWTFNGKDGSDKEDPLYGFKSIKELYLKADPNYNLRYTVPTLWDKQKEVSMSNGPAS